MALSRDLWHPGNPTYLADVPSVRYSPYTVGLALTVRGSGLDAYRALSAAAVLNTVLMLAGVWALLGRFGETRCAPSVLLTMLVVWGAPPRFANSYALSDLPWHQVNPSALAFALSLWIWCLSYDMVVGRRRLLAWSVSVILLAVVLLSHVLTAGLTVLGMFAIVISDRNGWRRSWRTGAAVAAVIPVAMAIAAVWPWYDFASMLLHRRPIEHAGWFAPRFERKMFLEWAPPAAILSIGAISIWRRPLVRAALIIAGVGTCLGLVAFVLRSAALSRFPMFAMVGMHLAGGVFVAQRAVWGPRGWIGRLRALVRMEPKAMASALIDACIVCLFVLLLAVHGREIVSKPWLARTYVAPIVGKSAPKVGLRARLTELLRPVGEKEVVLADASIAMPVPSFGARLVYSPHPE